MNNLELLPEIERRMLLSDMVTILASIGEAKKRFGSVAIVLVIVQEELVQVCMNCNAFD